MNSKKSVKAMVLFLSIGSSFTYANSNKGNPVIASWVQYTASGVEVRSVTKGDCPALKVDDKSIPMKERAKPTKSHNDKVCSASLGEDSKSVVVAGQNLPVVKQNPEKILIIGDTGCRVSSGHGLYQACNNSSEWPFKRLAESAASHNPDLIIYTGDYIYREAPCPEGNNGCKGTPYGDNLATWKADWLIPAQPLHLTAPMILTRGNHETCKRAGMGWFRYLDARPYDNECKLNNFPWVADVGSHDIAVMDTANLKDESGNALTKRFENEFIALKGELNKNTWLMTHRPFWGYGADDDDGKLTVQTEVLQDAVRAVGLPKLTTLLISAHLHLAEIIAFKESERPPQLIIGNGGTQLVPDVPEITEIDGEAILTQRVLNQFGYAMMYKMDEQAWSIIFYDQSGHELESCQLTGKELTCQ